MRNWAAAILAITCVAVMAACSVSKAPPAGRWQGTYESSDDLVAVRLEIMPDGAIHLVAPDAVDIGAVPAGGRGALRRKLAGELASKWRDAENRAMEFDGRVFRKPGGVVPQMEWNADSRTMTVILYLGKNTARVPLRAVGEFSSDPWAG